MKTLYEIGSALKTDKIIHHRYDLAYSRYLESFRDTHFNMLEIGVESSLSIDMWKEYFPKSFIYGIDIFAEFKDSRSKCFKLDQSSSEDLQIAVDNIPKCKFIIDDGSHHPAHQCMTFTKFFEELLEDGGVYIIEDIECNYWESSSEMYGYNRGHFNFIDVLKTYPDKINQEFSGIDNSLNIATVTFAQNCVIITKQTKEESMLFSREYRYKDKLSKKRYGSNFLEFMYEKNCVTESDTNEHLPVLKKYSLKCDHVTEMGVRKAVSSWGLLAGKPKTMISYDVDYHPNIELLRGAAKEENISFEFIKEDVLNVEIENTDLLFIDTQHTYDQLKQELLLHSNKVNKYIIMHNTVTFGKIWADLTSKGLMPAIDEFLEENRMWEKLEVLENNNGLIVLTKKLTK